MENNEKPTKNKCSNTHCLVKSFKRCYLTKLAKQTKLAKNRYSSSQCLVKSFKRCYLTKLAKQRITKQKPVGLGTKWKTKNKPTKNSCNRKHFLVKFTKTKLLLKIKNLSEAGLFFISVTVIFTCTIQQLFISYPANFIRFYKKMFYLCNIYNFLIKTFLYLFVIILTFLTLIILFLYFFFVYWVNLSFTIGVERQVQRRVK